MAERIRASFDARRFTATVKELSTDSKEARKVLNSSTRKALTPIKKMAKDEFKGYRNKYTWRPFQGKRLARFVRIKTFFNSKRKWRGGYVTAKSNKKWPQSNLLRLFEGGTRRGTKQYMNPGRFFEKATNANIAEAQKILERELRSWINSHNS